VLIKGNLLEPASVARVGKDGKQLGGSLRRRLLQHPSPSVAVLHVGGSVHIGEDQSESVDEEEPLAPGDLLLRIVAPAGPLFFRHLDRHWLSRMAARGRGRRPPLDALHCGAPDCGAAPQPRGAILIDSTPSAADDCFALGS
jgi:hypothetical protein